MLESQLLQVKYEKEAKVCFSLIGRYSVHVFLEGYRCLGRNEPHKGISEKTAVKVVCGVFKLSLLRDDRDGCEFSGHFHSPRNHFLIVIFNLAHEETTFSAQSRKLSIPFRPLSFA